MPSVDPTTHAARRLVLLPYTGRLNASDAPAAAGVAVKTWQDQSGNGFHATQSTSGSRPLAHADGGVTFDGADDYLVPGNIAGGSSAVTMVCVCQIDTDPPLAEAQSGPPLGDFGTDTIPDHYPWINGSIFYDFGSTVRKGAGNPATALTGRHTLAVVSAAGSWRLYIDNTLVFTTGTNTVGIGTAPMIGMSTDSAVPYSFFDGKIYALAVFNSALSDADREGVGEYLVAAADNPPGSLSAAVLMSAFGSGFRF